MSGRTLVKMTPEEVEWPCRTLVKMTPEEVEWPCPSGSVLCVRNLKRPKHTVHEER